MGKKKVKICKMDKEISWLRFNERILEEAEDALVPLIERLNFIQLYTNNLADADERLAETEADKLPEIYSVMKNIFHKKDRILTEVREELEAKGIKHLSRGDLTAEEASAVDKVFDKKLLGKTEYSIMISGTEGVFNPINGIITDRAKRYVIASLSSDEGGYPHTGSMGMSPEIERYARNDSDSICYASLDLTQFSRKPIFRNKLRRVVWSGDQNDQAKHEYFTEEDLVLWNIDKVFAPFKVLEYAIIYVVWYEGLPERVEILDIGGARASKDLKKAVARCTGALKDQVITTLDVESSDIIDGIRDELSEQERKEMCFAPFEPRRFDYNKWRSITGRVCRGDMLLSYPYDSFETFIDLLNEAVNSPYTDEIRITIYRMIPGGKLMQALKEAVKMGIAVRAFVELRASGDEATNKKLSRELEDMGCYVYKGLDDKKVHAKICQIVRKRYADNKYITYIGTGNMNEKTAKRYTDLALITAKEEIGSAVDAFLKDIMLGGDHEEHNETGEGDTTGVADSKREGKSRQVLVSPYDLKDEVIRLIKRETEKGSDGRLFFKLNSLTDQDVINALIDASNAGVRIRMIVRGICSLLPGVDGYTENISIVNVVGRFLEHSRVYLFGNGKDEVMYISSADLMPRNTERRHEFAVRIDDKEIAKKIRRILYLNYNDDVKGRRLTKKGNLRRKPAAAKPIDSQFILTEESKLNS